MTPPHILLTHPALGALRSALEDRGFRASALWEDLPGDLETIRVVVHLGGQPLATDILQKLPRLELIACPNAGYDGIDLAWCAARGVAVSAAAGANAADVADHALGVMIGAWRRTFDGDRSLRAGEWHKESGPKLERRFSAARVGIVGLGRIGDAIARRLEPFGNPVGWFGPNSKKVAWTQFALLEDLACWADIFVLSCRADAANRMMVDRCIIEAIGPSGLLVNVARGSLVDEEALVDALRDGRLGGAALDVFEEEPTPAARWAGVPNTILTPHMAALTREAVSDMRNQLLETIGRFFDGKPLAGLVPLPPVSPAPARRSDRVASFPQA